MPKGLSEGDMVRITAIYLFTFAICIYFLSISNVYVADQHIQRYQVAKSIVEKGELSIPESAYSIRGMDGRAYSLYGLVWPILVIPFYTVGKFVGWHPQNLMLLLNPMVGAATVTLVFLFSIALGYSRRSSLVVHFISASIACLDRSRLWCEFKSFREHQGVFSETRYFPVGAAPLCRAGSVV